ncbi:MAG TPA: hypothetical protein DCW29_13565 [Janthinobacterium sp.]|nr:hypothetical protein [Janthinobacterium sp.]
MRVLLVAMGGLAVAAGFLLSTGLFHLSLAGACASAGAGVFCLLFAPENRKARRIDISGVGQIRLTVYQHMDGVDANGEGFAVSLMAGSTLWPGLLLLRLRREDGVDGADVALALWPGGAAFRPLAVACRAIAARQGEWE